MKNNEDIKFAFFGSSDFSVTVLNVLKENGLLPKLIVTIEDKPQGRKMLIKQEEVKVWAEKENTPYLQLKTLKTEESQKQIEGYFQDGADLFLVTHYGKMIPDSILNFPKNGTLNIHPSLLPKLRGASPIKSAILSEKETGVAIIKLDAEMDHGPILIQEKTEVSEWPPYEQDLKVELAEQGATMFVKVLPLWLSGEINVVEQDHSKATFCGKIEKTDALLNLNDSADTNLRKIRAFHDWPGAYFFKDFSDGTKKRIIVKKASIEKDELVFEKVIPEGKREMDYKDFLRGQRD